MIFPQPSYWRRTVSETSEKANAYVDKYLNQILTPVLSATDDHVICNMILQIMCEAWLDHIYINKIRFSHHMACQLLCDFAHIDSWLSNCLVVSQEIRQKMLKNEVLKRCEGVGRLLLRRPGEPIKMLDTQNKQQSDNNESMPAEMYVPNQEQWLELRAVKKRTNLFGTPFCCGKL